MVSHLIGHARVSTEKQDATLRHEALLAAGIDEENLYVDHGLTGTSRARPALRETLATSPDSETFMVTKLHRLALSVPDARDLVDELTSKGVKPWIRDSVHDPTDPTERLLLDVLAMVAELEADLIRDPHPARDAGREGEGSAARQKPKLSETIEGHLVAE